MYGRGGLDGGLHGVLVDEGLIALVGLSQRLAKDAGGEAGHASAGAEEQLAGGIGEDGEDTQTGVAGQLSKGALELAVNQGVLSKKVLPCAFVGRG